MPLNFEPLKTMKHTPGIWQVETACSVTNGITSVGEYFVRRDGDSFAIANDITDPDTGAPDESNARLIAAAPDLLAAAQEGLAAGKALMNIMKEMEVVDYIRAEAWLQQCGAEKGFGKRIMDAIEKATGSDGHNSPNIPT
jgi:hypothetical protein